MLTSRTEIPRCFAFWVSSIAFELSKISGATCKRGEAYAQAELTDPRRTLTTTMRVMGAGLVPVKSSVALPKALLEPSMDVINAVQAKAPVKPGDVLIADILGTGVDIVATDRA